MGKLILSLSKGPFVSGKIVRQDDRWIIIKKGVCVCCLRHMTGISVFQNDLFHCIKWSFVLITFKSVTACNRGCWTCQYYGFLYLLDCFLVIWNTNCIFFVIVIKTNTGKVLSLLTHSPYSILTFKKDIFTFVSSEKK